jgi:hypothetical protein
VTVFDGPRQVVARGGQSLVLDHYLEVLARKPGALPGATALQQARAAGTFTAAHDAFWGMARSTLSDGAGTRALVEVLLLQRHLPAGDIEAGLTAALRLHSPSVDVVALDAREADGQPDPGPVPFSLALKRVARSKTAATASPTTPSSSFRRTRGRCPRSISTTSSSPPATTSKRRPCDERTRRGDRSTSAHPAGGRGRHRRRLPDLTAADNAGPVR